MYTQEEILSSRYAFFRPVSTKKQGYFCDFNRLTLKDGADAFRVSIYAHTEGRQNVDICLFPDGQWVIKDGDKFIPKELATKILAILNE